MNARYYYDELGKDQRTEDIPRICSSWLRNTA
jgi:hypothetical protein